MKIKKLVSALSALTIAAGVFAGMAVTASAAETTTLSANYVDSSAEDYVGNVDGWTADNGNVTVEWIDGTGVRMSTGKTPGDNGMTKQLGASYKGIIEGSFLWNVGTSTGKDNNYNSISVTDSSGVDVFEVRAHGQNGAIEVVSGDTVKETGNENSTYTRNVDWNISYEFNTVTKELSVHIDPDVGTQTWTYSDLESPAADITSFSTAWHRDGGGDASNNVVKSYSMTVTPYTAAAGSVTINYKTAEGTQLGSSTPDVSSNVAGDTLTYAYPKYITNGDLYKTTAEKTRASIALTAEPQNVDIIYGVEAEGEYYFYEFDGNYTTRADYESNGSARTGGATLTVPVDGEYIVTANCYGSASNRSATVTADGTTIVDTTTISIYAPGTDLISNKVMLKAGTEIVVDTSDSKSAVDYVILQRTGNYVPATVPASATATVVNGEYTTEVEEAEDNASLWQLNVKAGTNSIKSVGVEVKINDTAGETDKTITSDTAVISGSGEAVFAIVVNRHADEITEINALLDNTSYNAYTQTIE